MLSPNVIALYERIDPKPLWDTLFCREHNIVQCQAGSQHLGHSMTLQSKFNEQDIISDTRFSVYGDAYSTVTIAYLSEWLPGTSRQKINAFSYEALIKHLAIPENKTFGAILVMEMIEQLKNMEQVS